MTIIESNFDARGNFVIIIWVYELINFMLPKLVVQFPMHSLLKFLESFYCVKVCSLITNWCTIFPMLTSCGSSNCTNTLYNLIILIPLCMLNSFLKCTRLCNKWKHSIEMKHLNQTWLIAHKSFFKIPNAFSTIGQPFEMFVE